MEENNNSFNNNKLVNILSILVIIGFLIGLIIVVINGVSKLRTTDSSYDTLVKQNETPVEESTAEVENTYSFGTDSVEETLEQFMNDVKIVLASTDYSNYETTSGISLATIANVRLALKDSADITYYTFWQADYELSTKTPEGKYLIDCDIRVNGEVRKLYLYTWVDFMYDKYVVTGFTYDIGDL